MLEWVAIYFSTKLKFLPWITILSSSRRCSLVNLCILDHFKKKKNLILGLSSDTSGTVSLPCPMVRSTCFCPILLSERVLPCWQPHGWHSRAKPCGPNCPLNSSPLVLSCDALDTSPKSDLCPPPGSTSSQISDPGWIMIPSPPCLLWVGLNKATSLPLWQPLSYYCLILMQ